MGNKICIGYCLACAHAGRDPFFVAFSPRAACYEHSEDWYDYL